MDGNGISTRNLLPVEEWARVRAVHLQTSIQNISAGSYAEVAGIDGAIMATFVQGQTFFKIPIAAVYGLQLTLPA